MSRYYAGIGSRETPPELLAEMVFLGRALSLHGYVLRSGAAEGADTAFEKGSLNTEAYVPWAKHYQNDGISNGPVRVINLEASPYYRAAMDLAAKHHPRWDKCSSGARKLLARNGMQILGEPLNSPVEFVVCWTKDGKASGGTGQALRLAQHHGIAIYNLRNEDDRLRLQAFVTTFG